MTRSPRPVLPPQQPPSGVPLRLPMHPGRFLERQYLLPLAINQTRAAALLGVSRRRINELVMGHRAMSPDTALRCALAFGTSASFWLGLQARWDCYHAWHHLRQQLGHGLLPPTPSSAPTQDAQRQVRQAARGLRQQAGGVLPTPPAC